MFQYLTVALGAVAAGCFAVGVEQMVEFNGKCQAKEVPFPQCLEDGVRNMNQSNGGKK